MRKNYKRLENITIRFRRNCKSAMIRLCTQVSTGMDSFLHQVWRKTTNSACLIICASVLVEYYVVEKVVEKEYLLEC
jgi:hypothetical protein